MAKQHEIRNKSLLEILQPQPEPSEKFFTVDDEQRLANWAANTHASGFRLTPEKLCHTAALLMRNRNKVHRFSSAVTKNSWCQSFVKQYPNVKLYATTENIEWKASDWFVMVRTHLKKRDIDVDILLDPSRVFCLTELAFALQLEAGPGVVIEKKGAHRPRNADCDEVTVMLGGNAAGTLVPPMVLFDRMGLPKTETEYHVPPAWIVTGSETGWMTAATLFEYIVDTIHPWLLNHRVTLPVVVFLDGFSTHLTHVLSEYCERSQIVLIGLPATETNAIQPLDLCVLGPLLGAWRHTLATMPNNIISPGNFCALLSDALDKHAGCELFEYAFKVCGIFPFPIFGGRCHRDGDTIESESIRGKRKRKRIRPSDIIQHCLAFLEEKILERNPHFDDSALADIWTGNEEDASFFQLWKEIKREQNEIDEVIQERDGNDESTSDIENRHGQRPQSNVTDNDNDKTDVLRFCLSQLEEQVSDKLDSFLKAPSVWNGPEEDESLYRLWREMQNDLERCEKLQSDNKRMKDRILHEPVKYVCKIPLLNLEGALNWLLYCFNDFIIHALKLSI